MNWGQVWSTLFFLFPSLASTLISLPLSQFLFKLVFFILQPVFISVTFIFLKSFDLSFKVHQTPKKRSDEEEEEEEEPTLIYPSLPF